MFNGTMSNMYNTNVYTFKLLINDKLYLNIYYQHFLTIIINITVLLIGYNA